MKFDNVLVLGAHPDDEMGAAGLIYRLAQQGARINVATFSQCQDLNDAAILREEWLSALYLLGVSEDRVQLFDLPNRRLPEHRSTILNYLDATRTEGWDLVLCPSTLDAHQDHATVTAEARRAFKDTTVLGYELPLNSVGLSKLDAYAEVSSAAMGAKRAHARAYHSQEHKPYMKSEYIEALGRVRGLQAGMTYAEAFEVIRWVL